MKLGLIGNSIKHSKAPVLHRLAGSLAGVELTYELLAPPSLGLDFETVFRNCMDAGFRGINITYPYKEQVVGLLDCDPLSKRVGAANTVVFEGATAIGYNTDASGFVMAYRHGFANMNPGRVALIGAGGVGRAVAVALCELGARAIRVVDRDMPKAADLAAAISALNSGTSASVSSRVEDAVYQADGIVNCSPVGMHDQPGCPVPREVIGSQRWAFDAVYTPVRTAFMTQAADAGLQIMTGFELFLSQGIQAFEIFSGHALNQDALRSLLAAS